MASRSGVMKNIYWNVRRLGSPRSVRRLRHLLKQHNPHMVFLMETKIDIKTYGPGNQKFKFEAWWTMEESFKQEVKLSWESSTEEVQAALRRTGPTKVLEPMASQHYSFKDFKVVELIDSNERKWKRELINNTFPEVEAKKILSISLPKEPHADILTWSREPSGEYSIRSAYKLLQISDPRAYALQTDYRDFYRKLWLLDLPPKIKVTISKISWNYLPTRANMVYRKLVNSFACPRCSEGVETMDHLLRECPILVSVWRALSTSNFIQESNIAFDQWLSRVFV
ncbi:hypothetical protein J1N35_010633 [Gossypium stocksii]|uniref:Reverse transcriptase zinc-binding domain-containing protein n=1 Tax=Gossypium stocksii TaxID=47602 RepID=A0A9D3W2K6_9ROSI|nr:hypothetical protein J1N35_010633 [Gossypium stocksii]